MEMKQEMVTIETNGKEFILTPSIVTQYICPKATKQEIYYFLQLCKAQNLNPFIREVYLIKYSDSDPATMVTGKETFLKRAMKNPKFQGHKAWTIGSVEAKNLQAIAEIYVSGYQVPIMVEVDYDEYVGTRYDKASGKKVPNKMWTEKPKTMLRKVALMQALREAFPDELGGLYDQTEINTIPDALPETEIKIVDTNTGEVTNVTVAKEPVKAKKEPVKEVVKEEVKVEEIIEAEVVEQEIPKSVEAVMEEFGATEVEEVTEETAVEEEVKPEVVPEEALATEAQLRMIFSVGTKKNLNEELVHAIIKDDYNVDSAKKLTKKQASKLIEYLLNYQGDK